MSKEINLVRSGKNLSDLMRYRNVPNYILAQEIGVSERTVCKWKKGKAMPSVGHALRISEILGMDISKIWQFYAEK